MLLENKILQMTWTDKFQQKEINEFSNEVLNTILDKIAYVNIEEFNKEGLSKSEIKLLLRWNLYVSINTFTERLLRVKTSEKRISKKQKNLKKIFNYHYTNLIEVTLNYYNNDQLNNDLLYNIDLLLRNSHKKIIQIKDNSKGDHLKRNRPLFQLRALLKLFIFKYIYLFIFKYIYKIEELHEETKQTNIIFSKKQSFINYPFFKENRISYKSRSKIREISQKIFIKKYSKFINNDQIKINAISKLFSCWLEYSIPFSLLESLNERFLFYNEVLDSLKIKALHAGAGFFTNENIKIFSILLKRKKIKVIGHEHGINNFIIPGKTEFMSNYKGLDYFSYPDIILTWGSSVYLNHINKLHDKGKKSDKWKNIKNFNVKVIDTGSVYLNHINKLHDRSFSREIRLNSKSSYFVFYCASQFRNFMTNLEEMSPEDNLKHKIKICKFLKKIILKKKIKLIYKQFPENVDNKNDPFFKILKNEIKKEKVIISSENAVKIMHSADLILFDIISTGFGEAININKPALVYTNKFEYNRASSEGKKINDLFYKAGIFFNKDSSGFRSIDLLIKNTKLFQRNTKNLINIFKQKICYPVDKSVFLKKMKDLY